MFKYSIIEESNDPLQAVIRKEGVVVEFKLQDLETDKKRAEKIKQEIITQLELDEAQMKNVEINHPYVLEMSEEDVKRAVAIALHNGLKNKVKASQSKLAEIETVFLEHKAELEDIKNQTGINLDEVKGN